MQVAKPHRSQRVYIFIMFFSLLISGCGKDKTSEIDIIQYSWRVTSVKASLKPIKRPKKNIHGKDILNERAYVLEFINDSIFLLDLSINTGGGRFHILSKGEIEILNYGGSKVCCDSKFDDNLVGLLMEVTTYKVKGDKLTFYGATGKVEFKRM